MDLIVLTLQNYQEHLILTITDMKITKLIIINFILIIFVRTNLAVASEITGTLSTGLTGTVNDRLVGTVVDSYNTSSGGGGGFLLSNQNVSKKIDVNNDGKVDKYDFALMMSNWGKTGTNSCDFNGDGKVDKYDFALLMSKWGL